MHIRSSLVYIALYLSIAAAATIPDDINNNLDNIRKQAEGLGNMGKELGVNTMEQGKDAMKQMLAPTTIPLDDVRNQVEGAMNMGKELGVSTMEQGTDAWKQSLTPTVVQQ
ncbi:hypothetical protein OG21DRAFT_1483811 [Imleria badia]|nr:hypothetical protein OG21DRAFT_1483811 [Imleria badia]